MDYKHARLACPSPIPRAYSNPCPLSQWCHPIISSSVVPVSSCLQSCPASGSFPMSQFFASCGQSIGVSASASVLPMNLQGWFPLGLTGLISLLPMDSQESSPTPQFESINSLVLSLLYGSTLTSICDYWKNHSLDYIHLCWQKVHIVKVTVFPVVMYGCESWTIKKAECWRIDAFELWY